MAKTNLNTALDDVSGKISKWVYRKVGDGVVISPYKKSKAPPTANQVAQRERFRIGASWARERVADPVQRVFYEAIARLKKIPLFATIVGDYFTPPTVDVIELTAYTGQTGSKIKVFASDDVQVASVKVVIRDNTNQAVLEQGAAALVNGSWPYTATTNLPGGHPVTIHAIATDRAGNIGDTTIPYP